MRCVLTGLLVAIARTASAQTATATAEIPGLVTDAAVAAVAVASITITRGATAESHPLDSSWPTSC